MKVTKFGFPEGHTSKIYACLPSSVFSIPAVSGEGFLFTPVTFPSFALPPAAHCFIATKVDFIYVLVLRFMGMLSFDLQTVLSLEST